MATTSSRTPADLQPRSPDRTDRRAVTDYPFDGYEARISFSVKDHRASEDQGGLDVRFSRATSVLVFALFMMITTWGLAIAAFFGARHLIALAGFRDLAPGSPPIGSLLDYTAFLWAEVVIAW